MLPNHTSSFNEASHSILYNPFNDEIIFIKYLEQLFLHPRKLCPSVRSSLPYCFLYPVFIMSLIYVLYFIYFISNLYYPLIHGGGGLYAVP